MHVLQVAPVTSVSVENIIGSNNLINHTDGSPAKINKYLQFYWSRPTYCFHNFVTKSVLNNQKLQFLPDPPHKMWE